MQRIHEFWRILEGVENKIMERFELKDKSFKGGIVDWVRVNTSQLAEHY